MSRFFSRLSLQHHNQGTLSIKPALSPVFPVEIGGVDNEQLQTHKQFESSAQIKKNDSDTSESYSLSFGKEQSKLAKIKPSDTPLLKPVKSSTFEEYTAQETVKYPSIISPLTAELEPSTQLHLPKNNNSATTPYVSDINKNTKLSPENQSFVKQKLENSQIIPSRIKNQKEQLTQQFSQHVHDENQTTVNISIGQIEIKATQAEKIEKIAPLPNRNRSNALEEYHQKRVRGER